ncbi:MAG TPA: hypothetical protein VG964_03515, partial [Candidatus Saccharimonadales bacterium]|nr:hypothetical protein [Candidatus Saccharimonadales bacterium]
IKVALILQDGLTYPKSSAFIRLISPLSDPSLDGKLSMKLFPGNTSDIGPGFDACIVQRTAVSKLDTAKKLVANLKKSDTRLILDSDDAFHAIDPNHPEHGAHTERLEVFNFIAEKSDQVWLSTERLVDAIKPLNKNVKLVRNSLDKRLWRLPVKSSGSGPIRIVHMGTVSHDDDFKLIFPALQRLAEQYPGSFQLSVIGVAGEVPDLPWLERIYQPAGHSIYPRFVSWFLGQGPFDIGLSPLVDNDFNRNKSDIKCLDYLAAGILPVVSDIEPYRSAELAPYIIKFANTKAAWQSGLEEILRDPDGFRKRKKVAVTDAQDYLWRERGSAKTAADLYGLLGGK